MTAKMTVTAVRLQDTYFSLDNKEYRLSPRSLAGYQLQLDGAPIAVIYGEFTDNKLTILEELARRWNLVEEDINLLKELES